jgi:hypothetical protein
MVDLLSMVSSVRRATARSGSRLLCRTVALLVATALLLTGPSPHRADAAPAGAVVASTTSPVGGIWTTTATGLVVASAGAANYGSTADLHLNFPIVAIAATPDGHGYWLAASDGGIFAFGDAPFYGSTGALKLNKPIVAMTATPDGHGYWLAASDGGIFTFGDALFYGSNPTGGSAVVAVLPSTDNLGYTTIDTAGDPIPYGGAETTLEAPPTAAAPPAAPDPQNPPSAGGSTPPPTPGPSSGPLLGILGYSGTETANLVSSGVQVATIGITWSQSETAANSFDLTYIDVMKKEIRNAEAAGLSVIIDPGLQYPPSWVFGLPGGTRFVDQYGDAFTGAPASALDVANAVTDTAVRQAEGSYLTWLGSQLASFPILGVRAGGGPNGELRYPDADYDGHTDCYWAYDTSSQAVSPTPGWTPGTGTTANATAFLSAYNAQLDSYGDWLVSQLAADFNTKILLMLPGWGQRPGVATKEESSLLTLSDDEFNQGLDWTDLLAGVPDAANIVAYTTYLDGSSYNTTPQGIDPADFIASIANPLHIALGGENTGNGSISDLDLSFSRARSLSYWLVQWMDEQQLVQSTEQGGAGPTFGDLAAAALSYL